MSTSALHRVLIAGACALVVLPGLALAADAGTDEPAAAAEAAAPQQKLSVSPTSQDLVVSAGDTTTVQLTVTAPGTAIRVGYEHADYGLDEDYAPVLIPDTAEKTTSFSTRGWFSTKQPTAKIAAGKSAKLTFTIDIPENTPGGTYIGAILLSITPDEADEDAQIQARAGVASVVFLNVDGGDPPKPHVQRFDVPRLVGGDSFTPKLEMTNKGSMTFEVDGVIELDGKEITENGRIAPQHVLPDMPRDIRPQSNGKDRLKIDTSKLSMGRHTVTARLRIDPTNDTLVVERTFWVIPVWVRVLAGLGVLVVLLLLSWLAMRLWAWRSARAARGDDAPVSDTSATPAVTAAATPVTAAPVVDAEPDTSDDEVSAGDEDASEEFVDWADDDVAHEVESFDVEDEDEDEDDLDDESDFDDASYEDEEELDHDADDLSEDAPR